VTNPVRHHHHIENEILEVEQAPETTTTAEPVTEAVTESDLIDDSAKVSEDDKILAAETKKKLDEKAMRRERLKEKLSKLSPEQRQAFLLMKQQRAEAKKKGLLAKN
jgi:DNA-directed RNA polymerase specialized sigma24 family protein